MGVAIQTAGSLLALAPINREWGDIFTKTTKLAHSEDVVLHEVRRWLQRWDLGMIRAFKHAGSKGGSLEGRSSGNWPAEGATQLRLPVQRFAGNVRAMVCR